MFLDLKSYVQRGVLRTWNEQWVSTPAQKRPRSIRDCVSRWPSSVRKSRREEVIVTRFRFLLIYRKANAGELLEESGLSKLAKLTEISVEEVGVGGAKNFFQAKIEELNKSSKFEEEIRQEQEERKRDEQERQERKTAFKQKAALFQNGNS
uniref:Uncharacterized protein n=1 Tax=Timema bartmani TaxID=61472 RepID=A0A7R9I5K7_9NEOP|nr:unnamed protein product [Timema bartmani]